MERIKVGNCEIEFDRDETKRVYEERFGGCECEFCWNAHITSRRHSPNEQVQILQALGVDPWRPIYQEFGGRRPYDHPSYVRRTGYWHVHGRIVTEAPAPPVKFDRWDWMWAGADRLDMGLYGGRTPRWSEREQNRVYLFSSNALPWLHEGVTGFWHIFAKNCPICRSYSRQASYLKKRSLIPLWMGAPHLQQVLMGRKSRVYVEFCVGCGTMEHKIVPRVKPFREKSELHRKKEKLWRALTHLPKSVEEYNKLSAQLRALP